MVTALCKSRERCKRRFLSIRNLEQIGVFAKCELVPFLYFFPLASFPDNMSTDDTTTAPETEPVLINQPTAAGDPFPHYFGSAHLPQPMPQLDPAQLNLLSLSPVLQQHALAERLAIICGGNQRVQQCQNKMADVTAEITSRLKTYHSDQDESNALQKECSDLRSQLHSLQTTLSEKLSAQRCKALESEYGLRHIKDLLLQSQTLSQELASARAYMTSLTTKFETNLAAQTQIPVATPPSQPVATAEEPSFPHDIPIKRERERDYDEDDDHRDGRKKFVRREPCLHYNNQRGCHYTASMCRREHRCLKCASRNHPIYQCDMEIYDRRRR